MAVGNDDRRTAPQNNVLSLNQREERLTEELEITTLGGENNELKVWLAW